MIQSSNAIDWIFTAYCYRKCLWPIRSFISSITIERKFQLIGILNCLLLRKSVCDDQSYTSGFNKTHVYNICMYVCICDHFFINARLLRIVISATFLSHYVQKNCTCAPSLQLPYVHTEAIHTITSTKYLFFCLSYDAFFLALLRRNRKFLVASVGQGFVLLLSFLFLKLLEQRFFIELVPYFPYVIFIR